MSNRPLNVGLIGGGKGAFIVQPHQKAIHFDGTRRVTAGALFPDAKIALEEATRFAPASFLQLHPNSEMVITKELLNTKF